MKRDIKKLLSSVENKLVRRIHEKPSREALNRLAIFVGYESWEDFLRETHEATDVSETVGDEKE